MNKEFWKKFYCQSNTDVNSPAVVVVVMLIATGILFFVSIILIVYHCFYHGKGLDGEAVKLILGLMGSGSIVGGLGSYFTKTFINMASSETTTTTTTKEESKTNKVKAKPKTDGDGEV